MAPVQFDSAGLQSSARPRSPQVVAQTCEEIPMLDWTQSSDSAPAVYLESTGVWTAYAALHNRMTQETAVLAANKRDDQRPTLPVHD